MKHVSLRLKLQSSEDIKRRFAIEKQGKVQMFIDSEVLRRCVPYVPQDKSDLIKSGQIGTVIGSGTVRYVAPYARRWYYMPAQFQGAPKRGNYWFERMKKAGGAAAIARGAKKIMAKGSD